MVALGVANVGIALWLNIWNRDFFNALEKRDLARLFELLWILAIIVVSAGVAVAIQLHVKRRLQINWRSWLSGVTVQRWLHSGRQYQLGLLAEEVDNPDGRIAEDIRVATEFAAQTHCPKSSARRNAITSRSRRPWPTNPTAGN